jgi:hypothetical protein
MEQSFLPKNGPVKKDGVDFMGTKREKILDFSLMRGKTAGDIF